MAAEPEVADFDEVAGPDASRLLTKEGGPTLTVRRCAADLAQVPLDGSLGDGDAELEELTADALGAPQAVLGGHAADEVDDVGRNAGRGGRLPPGAPLPEQSEAVSMPAKKGVRLDEHEGIAPAGEDAGKGDEKEAVPGTEPGLLRSATTDGELMSQECVLGAKFLGGAQEVGKEPSGDAGGSARRGPQARQGSSAGVGASASP